jgi:hypothetical protein
MEFEQMLIEAPYTAFSASFKNLPAHGRGAALARALSWSGSDIFDLMIDALIDSNFHTEATALRAAWFEFLDSRIDAQALAHEALTNQD